MLYNNCVLCYTYRGYIFNIDMENKRAFLLDVFRIILCLGVVLYHYTPARPSIGPFMVNGFLIMSGFLIGRMFISCPSFDVVRFYHNKAKRLLPMFAVALLMGVLWHGYTNTIKPEWTVSEWGNFSMIGWMSYYNTPLWYMGVEFAMLLIVPILYCIFQKKWLLIGFTLLTTIVTWSLYCQVPDNTIFGAGLYFSPFARCWQFVVGILSSCVCEKLYIFSKFHKKY